MSAVSYSAGARTRKRKKARRLVDHPVILATEAVFSIVVLGAFLYGFLGFLKTFDGFDIKTVSVTGAVVLTPAAVREAAALGDDTNILLLDKNAIIERVTALPYVKSASLEVTFPDKITINVEERTVDATLMINSRAYELDAEGVVLREYASGVLPKEPFITNVPGLHYVEAGAKLDIPEVVAALEVWRAFEPSAVSAATTVSEIAALHPDDIRMYCVELPYEIRWGRHDAGELAKQLDVLWAEHEGLLPCKEYVDLRFAVEQGVVCK